MTKRRKREVNTQSSLSLTDHVSVVKCRDDRVIGFSESQRDGISSAADLLPTAQIKEQITGRSPQGECDSLPACRILVRKLNLLGASWDEPTVGVEPADCESRCRVDADRVLRIQVVRANPSQSIWRSLAENRTVMHASVPDDLIAELETAVLQKSARYSGTDASKLILALDANRLPAFALTAVRELAIAHLTQVCQATPFAAVWLVGPTPDLTYSLK